MLIRFLSVVLTAVAMAGAFAHLFELPNKIKLSREDYLTVQGMCRGWAFLGIPAVGALVWTGAWTVTIEPRGERSSGDVEATAFVVGRPDPTLRR